MRQRKKRRTAKGAKFSTEGGRREGGAAAARKSKRLNVPLSVALEFYRPLKKPITVRIDADVLAWFKKDGRKYQTRINQALRKVMDKEMRKS